MRRSARFVLTVLLLIWPLMTAGFAAGDSPPGVGVDWLIDPSSFKAGVTAGDHQLILSNGLVRRMIRLQPDAATVLLENLGTHQSLLRSVRPEAVVEIDKIKYSVGGLLGQKIQNYLDPRWLEQLTADPSAFHFSGFEIGKTQPRLAWKRRPEWMPTALAAGSPVSQWPPPGVSVTLTFSAPPALGRLFVLVHYEIYDGLPLVCKWITVQNQTEKPIRLDSFISETLAAVESESIVDDTPRWQPPDMDVETDYTFGGMSPASRNVAVHWLADPSYTTQVNYRLQTPCLLEVRPPLGPDQIIPPGGSFDSFRTFELLYDSTDRERRGLAVRKMYRAMAPWVTENPILMHLTASKPDAVKAAVDQCAAAGFELLILSFGSGFNFESRDPAYQQQYKELAAYAHSKGVGLGGYSLLASRSAQDKADNTQGVKARFGVMPCLGSQWGVDYLAGLSSFIGNAKLDALENDGSYPGDLCAATNHPFHHGLEDSQWVQWKAITGLYQSCRASGVYLNIPDWYFLNGGSKTGMGYRETDWSLPREYQEIIERQNVFDGTWEKTSSMGWMFVPLTQYHGGGKAATIEPLQDHLQHYEHRMADLFGAGVQACYRGPRLYDSPQTLTMVQKMVGFYKQHRAILDSDIIHLRRPDGADLDYILHANPALDEKGLLMIYNPTPHRVERTLAVPLYYTGLTNTATMITADTPARAITLDRMFNAAVPVAVDGNSYSWVIFK